MLSVSLPFSWLKNGGAPYGDRDVMLERLKARGVVSCELRSVRPDTPPRDVLDAARLLAGHGLRFTVHGAVRSPETAVSDVLAPLELLFSEGLQDKITVTVHPIDGDNAAMLTVLADVISAQELPVTIALENNRLLPDKTDGDSAALVLEAVKAVNRPCIGICFDMGHYYYFTGKPDALPPKEFLRRIVHTHIHAMTGGQTHFPLDTGVLPLESYLQAMEYQYFGLYNLELEPNRWRERDAGEAMLASLDRLEAAMPSCARLYDDIRRNFDARFTAALDKMAAHTTGTAFSLVQSASYLFCTDGMRWAMDLAFRHAYTLAKTPDRAAELLGGYEFMILSHGHVDHFEERTIRHLAKTGMRFIAPPFLEEIALAWGIAPERLIIAKAGETLQMGGLAITPFESRHFRPGGGAGVDEYGWRLETSDITMNFPVDVRDYDVRTMPDIPDADVCFGNVWFGDNNLAIADGICEAEAEFLLRMSKKIIILTHLYENGRTAKQMWRLEHAQALTDAIHALSPDTRVIIPKMGDVFTLEEV